MKFYQKVLNACCRNSWYLVIFFQIAFILSRFIGYQNPLMTSDYGNHLLISKYIAQGRIPYKEFSLTHMPGLYIPMVLGFLISGSTIFPFLFTTIIVSLIFPSFYLFIKDKFRYKSEFLVFLGLIFIFTDPMLTMYTKVATFDTLCLPFIMLSFSIMEKKKVRRKDYLLLAGLFFISLFIKITTVYFFAFWISLRIVFFIKNKFWRNNSIIFLFILFSVVVITFLFFYLLVPELLSDIFISHLFRPSRTPQERISSLFSALLLSPLALIPIFALSFLIAIFSKDKNIKFWFTFSYLFILFSVFVPKHFYRHHLIYLIPIGVYLLLSLIEKTMFFLENRNRNWPFFISISGSLLLSVHSFLWFILFLSFNQNVWAIYRHARELDGQLYASNNYYYFAADKEPYFWYYTTIPDGPCRWANLCSKQQEILAKADIAMVDVWARRHIFDPGFYDYLNTYFYLEDYDAISGLMLYIRR